VRLLRLAAPGLLDTARAPGASVWIGSGGPARPRRRERLPHALFAVCLALGVLPLWVVPHVATQDGGNHVESVLGLLRLPHSALLQQYYHPNVGLQPNWLTQILLAGLVQVCSPRIAEKVVLTGYLLAFPLAFRAALPRSRRGDWAALTIFPFVHSYPFHMGFWNFSYSLVLFFVAVGYWYRTRGRLDLRRGLAFTAITTALFVAHSVSTSAALGAMCAVLAWRAGLGVARAGRRRARRRLVLRGYLRRGAATVLYALPAVALLVVFFLRQPRPLAYRPALLDYAKHLVSLYALVSFDKRELFLTGAFAALLAAAVVATLWQRRRPRLVDGWLAAAGVGAALYFATPDSVADGAQLNDRLALYPFFAALLWLAYAAVPLRRVRRLALALSVLFLAGTAWRLVKYRQLDAYLADYESAGPHIAEGSTILPLTFAPFGPRQDGRARGKKLLSYRVQVFQHVTGYLATDRHGVDLDNSQARTQHAPLRWRDELNPFTYLDTHPFGLESEPPCVELWPYPALGGRIDYVLVWGATEATARTACGAAVLAELAAGYRRTYVSPLGMVQLFEPVRPAPGGG
jgi:hypothetical protein